MSSDHRRGARLLLAGVTAALLLAPGLAPGSPLRAQSPAARADGAPMFYPDDPVWSDPDDIDIPRPEERDVNQLAHAISVGLGGPDVEDVPAMNVNTLGEVPDSSWFRNRLGRGGMSMQEILRGPSGGGPPAPGTWKAVGHPGEGQTLKLVIEDPDGRRFLLKFEGEGNPRMRSAAEVVCTHFFHAFGYNVPENHAVVFDPEDVVPTDELDPDDLPAEDMEDFFARVPRTPDGRIRALASAWLPGEPVGPYLYSGTRPDDPNDVFPHQHRRELRGLKVFAAWLDHTDIKPNNTLDMYVEEDGHHFVRHHLIDFGSCMGSGALGPKNRMLGYERYVDAGGVLKGVFTFGLWSPGWAGVEYPDYPSVGNFEADYYEPWLWKTPIPAPALADMDAADAFWAARILALVDDRTIAEVVGSGRYGDPEQERYVVDTLVKRRDKTVAYWLTRTNPLDRLRLEAGAEGTRLLWDNAAVREGVADDGATYRVRWFRLDNESGERQPMEGAAAEPAAAQATSAAVPDHPWGPEDRFGLRYAVAEVSTLHPDYPHWSQPVVVTLRLKGDGSREVVGVRRPRQMPPAPDAGDES